MKKLFEVPEIEIYEFKQNVEILDDSNDDLDDGWSDDILWIKNRSHLQFADGVLHFVAKQFANKAIKGRIYCSKSL